MALNPRNPALLAGLLLTFASAAAQQTWRVTEGTTSIAFHRQLINDLGLRITDVRATATPRADHENAVGFAVVPATNLQFEVRQWSYQGWEPGQVLNSGGFTLTGPGGSVRLDNFSVEFRNTGTNDNMFVKTGPGANDLVVFDLSHIKVNFFRPENAMTFGFADAHLSERAARRLGAPKLAGMILGMVTVSSRAKFVSGDPNDSPPAGAEGSGGVNGNVKLHTLGSCDSFGRVGTYPNGTSGLGMSTTSCNVAPPIGTPPYSGALQDNIEWYAQMDERHPVIPQNFYRITTVNGGTRFEQIGAGWVKHGFLSTNSNGCGTCIQPPQGGNALGVNCSDTYGSSLNASRNYLGPRNEVNPFTGWWECTGSYFSNYVNDCVSRFSTSGLDAVAHRLQVRDQDLLNQPAGTIFMYEACYISHDDIDRYNNAASRTCVPTWNGSTWSFGTAGAQVQGVAIDRWNGPAARAQPQTEGDVLIGAKVTDLGSGKYHYEYAVYNHTSDRGTRTFSIPIPDGVKVENIEFRDIDGDATNQWTMARGNGAITWSCDTFAANPAANSLKWGTTYNFRFDAEIAPEATKAVMGAFKPGTLQTMAGAIQGPQSPWAMPTAYSYTGGLVAGGLSDLLVSDDYSMILRPGAVVTTTQAPATLTIESVVPMQTPAALSVRVETSASIANCVQKVYVKNFSTGAFVELDSRQLTTADGVLSVNVPSPANFVEAGTKKVVARLSFKPAGAVSVFPWQARIDQAVIVAQ